MSDLSFGNFANVVLNPGQVLRVGSGGVATVLMNYGGPAGTTVITASTQDFGPYGVPAKLRVTATSGTTSYNVLTDDGQLTYTEATQVAALVSGEANTYIRWCIPGRDTSGTLFKDISGHGHDATIDINNSAPFAVDGRMSTATHASAGGITQTLAATLCNLATDSFITSIGMLRADPGSNANVFSFGSNGTTAPGILLSHRASAAGVARITAQRGDTTVVSGNDTTVKFSNAGGTEEHFATMAYDGPTRSVYLYRDGVLAASNVALMTGSNAFVTTAVTAPARLGGQSAGGTFSGVYRGWQAYVFEDSGLPLNVGTIAAMLAENPSTPLWDHHFNFGA